MKYQSAKSIGFGILFWCIIIILIASGIIIFREYQSIAVVAACLIVIGFLLWIWYGTYYEFRDTFLAIRLGPFFENIPYSKIFSITPFRSMISSMALSNEMIELRHGKNYITGTTYISPVSRDEFMIELKKRCPSFNHK